MSLHRSLKKKVAVIVPTLNEAGTIIDVLDRLPKDIVDEILVVDGGSSDGTARLAFENGYRVLFQKKKGLANAIKQGIAETTAEIVIIIDSDGSHNPEDIPRFIEKLEDGFDLVIGSRYVEGGHSYDDTFFTWIGNRAINILLQLIHHIPINDSLMGYKTFRRHVINNIGITSQHQEFDAEIVIKANKRGFKIGAIPVIENRRSYGKSKLNPLRTTIRIIRIIIQERICR